MIIPTRDSNPFATCWTGPWAMGYLPTDGNTPEVLVQRLAMLDWRAEIVGPHGVGKSTLLRELPRLARAAGREWVQLDFYSGSRGASVWRLCRLKWTPATLLVIDGFEQLNPWWRRWVVWRSRRSGAGLLVTSHQATGLPTLIELAPHRATARAVFDHLTRTAETPVTEVDLHNAFNDCNGNVREVLFKLYDLHEHRVRAERVANKPRRRRVKKSTPPAAID